MKIFIIGYMFSGKTTVGKQLARRLGYHFIDTDHYFEERYGSISQYFATEGEAAFRLREGEILRELADKDELVVATGGGLPCFHDHIDSIKAMGVSIYLEASVGAILKRSRQAKVERPLLKNLSEDEARQRISEHLKQRSPFYQKANICMSAENVNIDSLLQSLQYFLPRKS